MSILFVTPLLAQIPGGVADQPIAKPVVLFAILIVLSLAPFLFMMTTSFVKISVVFSLIRSALGTQQIPPNMVITGLALILTGYIMIPVANQIFTRVDTIVRAPDTNQDFLSMANIEIVKKAFDEGKEPVRDFLFTHSSAKNINLFYGLAIKLQKANTPADQKTSITKPDRKDFRILIPAFIITELAEAFQIGFVLFLPFLVIDMVISNILLSMGMFMVSPVTVSLPFKLLLFVLVDGWALITRGLIRGYVG